MGDDEFVKRAIELCLAVYRVTERFPAAETLRFHLRQLSLDVIKLLVYNGAYPTQHTGRIFDFDGFRKRINLFLAYSKIAEKQGWVDPRNFEVLRSAYRMFENGVKEPDSATVEQDPVAAGKRGPKAAELSPRRLQILKFLEANSLGASMADFAKIIKGKSRKTIERDLKYLTGENLVSKKGRTKGARFFKT
jgi:hypothetical protein